MNYKLNSEKIREVLSDKNASISGIEKHLIQEGLKQITLGTGPVHIDLPGTGHIGTITPSLERYLIDAGVISKEENELISGYLGNASSIEFSSLGIAQSILHEPELCGPEFDFWDYAGHKENKNFFGTQKDWIQTMIVPLNKLSRAYLKKERKRYNCIITSPELGLLFEDLEYFHFGYDDNMYDRERKIEYLGSVANKYKVFADYELTDEVMILANVEDVDVSNLNHSDTWPTSSKVKQTLENTVRILNTNF